jgi:hypothetical protein
MVASTQIEHRLTFEARTAPVDPAGQDGNSVALESNKPDLGGGTSAQRTNGGGEPAYSVDISDEAQHVAANDSASASRTDTTQAGTQQTSAREDLNATVETSATLGVGSTVGETRDDGSTTNQVTSFEGERTGNDTQNRTEAGRTLGQVIDTFA